MHEKALKAQALGQVPTSPISETIHHHQEGAPHVHHRENSHSPQPHSPQHHVKESHHTHSPQHQHQPKHDSHPKESHPTQESSPTYNPFSPLAPHQRPQQQMPNLRRGRSGARAPERRRYAFGLKTRHGDLDSAVTWRGAGAGRIITAPSVVSV
ncbi:hypothetical protein BDQ17DRAFT_1347151 [Cyathus striatus]|nr:hypothetical protein BDQ17DRAFT_1347151 [Cyathus striatus]